MPMSEISRTQAWLESLRPKTLPLAFAAIIVGTALAWWQGHFDPLVALLALITAGLLQILSNLANDYGDAVKGSDKPDRIGPLRGMQKGVITQAQMKRALIITVVLICLSGLALVSVACKTTADFIGFLVLGGLSIVAAITYTVGTRPYGYIGLGDISVLVFFGWLSVMGSWYLQAHSLIPALFLPATACGLLATAVLNINNLRDIDSDRINGKNTLAVRLGAGNARPHHAYPLMGALLCLALFTRRYHAYLLMGALLCLALFNLFSLHSLWGWLFILAAPLLIKQARYVMREQNASAMPPMLERTVKGALLTNLLFVIGIVLSQMLG
nr:1,4-dihydroxy-2-naphthoate octaprenyltransferase [Pseudenterobacter timonensis]